MSKTVIKIENLSKIYRLGEVGTGTISHDLNRFWKMNILGKDDPYAKIGHLNDRTAKAEKGELVAALHDINLEVKEGEVLGIIGKNGAGKSTLLKILSRVTSPTTGSIKVKGRMASLLEVGTGFHPEMTGRENIYMNGTIMGMRRWEIDKQFDAIVDFAGIAKYVDTPVKRYSSGMTVRLGFAIAAHLEPEILVVDEVLAVGDAEFQKKAIGKMQDVSKNDGRTVLFVSHNMAAVKQLCNRGIILNSGLKVFDSSINLAINEYVNLNTSDINSTLLHDKKRSGNGKLRFTSITLKNKDQETSEFHSGEKLQMRLKYQLKENDLKGRLLISCSITDQYDLKLTEFVNDEMGQNLDEFYKQNEIVLTIPSIPFRKGRYYINLLCALNASSPENFLDKIEKVAYFDVMASDFYKSGKINRETSLLAIEAQYSFANEINY